MPKKQLVAPVVCPRCGQRADERPGFKLEDYEQLEAVIFDEGTLVGPDLPQRLVCRNCGKTQSVPRGSIEVRRP